MTRILAILGPTASGKTELAIGVAERIGGEVISVDSMQVYRGMDIGTAKPTLTERRGVPHHMIDVVDPDEEFNVAEFRTLGREIMNAATVPLVISGGSGLHFRALVDAMSFAPTDLILRSELEAYEIEELVERLLEADPAAGEHVDLENRRRVVRALEIYDLTGDTPSGRASATEAGDLRNYTPEVGFTAVGIDPGDGADSRIERRLDEMITAGLVTEVEGRWAQMGKTARAAVGYKEIGAYLEGERSFDEALTEIIRSTRKLARRQRTWFQRDPRIRWIPWSDDPARRESEVLEALS